MPASITVFFIDLRGGFTTQLNSEMYCLLRTTFTAGAADHTLYRQAVVLDFGFQMPGKANSLIQCTGLAGVNAIGAHLASTRCKIDFRKTGITPDQDLFVTGFDTVIATTAQVDKAWAGPGRVKNIRLLSHATF